MTARLVALAATTVIASSAAPPPPLRGVPISEPTGLHLLVANNPPLVLNVDTGLTAIVRSLHFRGTVVVSVRPAGRDALVWVDRAHAAITVPKAEIYLIRRGSRTVARLATGWEVAPSLDRRGLWIKSYESRRRCVLREIDLNGRKRRRPRSMPCSTRLIDSGTGGLLVRGSTVIDPRTGRQMLRGGALWARSGDFALTTSTSPRSLFLTNIRTRERSTIPWPATLRGRDQAVVQPRGGLVALTFSDPAYEGGGTQVTDVWVLDPATRALEHVPDMPSAVSLKLTSVAWTNDGRLVLLAQSGGRQIVGVWRPGEKRIGVRRVRLARNAGSDSFVIAAETRRP